MDTHHVFGRTSQESGGRGWWTACVEFGHDVFVRLLGIFDRCVDAADAYYASGRLQSKTDAMGQKVVYSYDGYGRLAYIDRYPAGASYYDPCQSVALTYDSGGAAGATNLLGRVSAAVTGDPYSCSGAVTENYSYTAGGLVTMKGYTYGGVAWLGANSGGWYPWSAGPSMTYTWDQEGHMTGYGSFSYTLDAMGRPTGLTESGPGTVWVQNVGYGPSGEMRSLQYRTSGGAYYTETNAFNNRNQVVDTSVSGTGLAGAHYQYGYAAGANNGQITAMTDVVTGEQVVYTYDSLKRLAKAETVGGPLWGQSFGYDGFGNLVSKTPTAGHTGTTMALAVDGATNHVATAGFSYDANGNMTGIPAVPTNLAPVYDIENRTGGGWYDQQNQPLDRAGVWNLYGLRGERLETHTYAKTLHYTTVVVGGVPYSVPYYTWVDTLVSRNVYFGSRLIQSNGQTVVVDRLGTVRANEAGDRASYYPYGEQQGGGMGDGREKFATYTREVASGLDYAGQRYYSPVYGRFTSADKGRQNASLMASGSWNAYAYGNGDPENQVDPSGRLAIWPDPDDPSWDTTGGPPVCNPGSMYYDPTSCFSGGGVGGAVDSRHPERVAPAQLCPLIALIGSYTTATSGSPVVALFAPDLAYKVDAALAILNLNGIVPVITDGFRALADQTARYEASKSGQSQYPAAKPGTGIHEVGEGIDFGINANGQTNSDAIMKAMKGQGLTWGGDWPRTRVDAAGNVVKGSYDPVHYENFHTPSPTQLAACEREHP